MSVGGLWKGNMLVTLVLRARVLHIIKIPKTALHRWSRDVRRGDRRRMMCHHLLQSSMH